MNFVIPKKETVFVSMWMFCVIGVCDLMNVYTYVVPIEEDPCTDEKWWKCDAEYEPIAGFMFGDVHDTSRESFKLASKTD